MMNMSLQARQINIKSHFSGQKQIDPLLIIKDIQIQLMHANSIGVKNQLFHVVTIEV